MSDKAKDTAREIQDAILAWENRLNPHGPMHICLCEGCAEARASIIRSALAEREEKVRALASYAAHWCNCYPASRDGCTCGLDAAKREAGI